MMLQFLGIAHMNFQLGEPLNFLHVKGCITHDQVTPLSKITHNYATNLLLSFTYANTIYS